MDLALILVVFIAAAAAVIVGLLVIGFVWMSHRVRHARVVATPEPDRKEPTPQHDSKPPPSGARGVVDQSIGMYVLRRLTGRPTGATGPTSATAQASSTRPINSRAASPPPELAPMTAEEVAYRLRIARAVPPDRRAPGVLPTLAAAPRTDTQRPAPPTEPVAPRERLARDAGLALASLLALGMVAFIVWPRSNPGNVPTTTEQDVAGASATPEISASNTPVATSVVGAAESPGGSVAAETFAPTPLATSGPRTTPKVPRATPRGTSKPSPSPIPVPSTAPSPSPAATPESTPSASPAPTPMPTPDPTPTPAPTPSAG